MGEQCWHKFLPGRSRFSYANETFRTSYPHAAEECILLKVYIYQKLREFSPIFSTDFSTGPVEVSRKSVEPSVIVLGRRPSHPNQIPSRKPDQVPLADGNRRQDQLVPLVP